MLLNFGTWPQSGLESWPPNRDYPSGVQPYDPYNPEARDIYWKHLQKGLFSFGSAAGIGAELKKQSFPGSPFPKGEHLAFLAWLPCRPSTARP